MNEIQLISLYSTLFYVSMAVAIVGLGLAVFFFWFFDIPTVYALMTGKAKENTIRRMAEQNAKTGTLRNQHIHTGPTGRTGKTKSSAELVQQPQPAVEQTVPAAEPEIDETSVLQNSVETVVLNQSGADAGETALLSAAPAPDPVPAGFRFCVTESTIVIHTDEMIS